MKTVLKIVVLLYTTSIFACGGGDWEDGMDFYNLFRQTNISAKAFYPFLRDEYNVFYRDNQYETLASKYPEGNLALWAELLTDWEKEQIENALYHPDSFDWTNKNTNIDQQAKRYIDFARLCSSEFSYRKRDTSWDYDEIVQHKEVDTALLLDKANKLLSKESNLQLKARYYYQIIRILHYSQDWQEAIRFYETKVMDKLPKNEIYYYITDQVAGCYYSTENYEKAAYLFTKVLNNSWDRKKSAFLSYGFCMYKDAEGKTLFKGVEDEKDLLLIMSLLDFSDEVNNILKFIALDANDERVELLFMRALNNVERVVWPKYSGFDKKALPYLNNEKCHSLLKIAAQQISNKQLKNTDFWKLASSYLSFIDQDIATAKQKLTEVTTFLDQKKVLATLYEVFSWKTIGQQEENFLVKELKDMPKNTKDFDQDLRLIIMDKVAHTYYKNNKIAKAFLVHNSLEEVNNLDAINLLDALETFYNKPHKTAFEKSLISGVAEKVNFIDYINYQKGIYYLYQKNPKQALVFFEMNTTYEGDRPLTNALFSNNIKECFECNVDEVMQDEVYKADVFSFIPATLSRKELAQALVTLEELTHSEKKWKVKLANYLLGNYYYNISNSGYFRGLLTSNSNCCNYTYLNYFEEDMDTSSSADVIIANRKGYNLMGIGYYEKHFFNLRPAAIDYYKKTIALSKDKELNARCLFLMAKCELNDFYSDGSDETFSFRINEYYDLELPYLDSYKKLNEDYADTQFHQMIIKECSYFRIYSNL